MTKQKFKFYLKSLTISTMYAKIVGIDDFFPQTYPVYTHSIYGRFIDWLCVVYGYENH